MVSVTNEVCIKKWEFFSILIVQGLKKIALMYLRRYLHSPKAKHTIQLTRQVLVFNWKRKMLFLVPMVGWHWPLRMSVSSNTFGILVATKLTMKEEQQEQLYHKLQWRNPKRRCFQIIIEIMKNNIAKGVCYVCQKWRDEVTLAGNECILHKCGHLE